jgi:hypothetical protein
MKMNKSNWRIGIGLLLISISAVIYVIHYLIFRNAHDIFFYMVMDIAFVFVQVLMVTLILDQLLQARDKKVLMQKLNMIIGVFFIEIGNDLLKRLAEFDTRIGQIHSALRVNAQWSKKEFNDLSNRIKNDPHPMESRQADLTILKTLLLDKKEFMLRVLENPNLLEHEQFTDLLWAVLHLAEELASRRKLTGLPEADYKHLSGDMQRAYWALISQWLNYMNHLREFYPYLFSLAVRTNPFDPDAVVEIQGEG